MLRAGNRPDLGLGEVHSLQSDHYIDTVSSNGMPVAPDEHQGSDTKNKTADGPWTWLPPQGRRFDGRASIVLIGLPGAGKRSLGFIAAMHLRRRFCTDHRYFEETTGLAKAAYLQHHGREEFMRQSLCVFQQMLDQNARDCVIECGVNSLAQDSRAALSAYAHSHPVIHVLRDFDQVFRQLQLRPEDIRRLRHANADHRLCSNFEFYNLFDPTGSDVKNVATETVIATSPWTLRNVKIDFCNFIDLVLGITSTKHVDPFHISRLPITKCRRTYATKWRLSELVHGALRVTNVGTGEDVTELCIDEWKDDSANDISKFVAEFRRHQTTAIAYSVDSKAYPFLNESYMELFEHGIRVGAEYVVIDYSVSESLQRWVLSSKGYSITIADHHFDDGDPQGWRNSARLDAYVKAKEFGYDIVRQTQEATARRDNIDVQRFQEDVAELDNATLPLIAYNNGHLGRPSKMSNFMLTPVLSHLQGATKQGSSQLRTGDMTIKQITQALFANFEYDPLQFYVLGSSISFTRSPIMHGTAFEFYGLTHHLQHCDVSSFEDALKFVRNDRCGGCCISFPFKEAAFTACTALSSHAMAIGSVNTIIPLRKLNGNDKTKDLTEQAAQRNKAGPVVGLYGDNNDWQGFYHNIRRKLSPRNAALDARSTALVLGAGGSARSAVYALILIGYQHIYIHNRTEQKALRLAEHFNTWCRQNQTPAYRTRIHVLKSEQLGIADEWPEGGNLPTVIIACVPSATYDFVIPEKWLSSPTGGVAADVSQTIQVPKEFRYSLVHD